MLKHISIANGVFMCIMTHSVMCYNNYYLVANLYRILVIALSISYSLNYVGIKF